MIEGITILKEMVITTDILNIKIFLLSFFIIFIGSLFISFIKYFKVFKSFKGFKQSNYNFLESILLIFVFSIIFSLTLSVIFSSQMNTGKKRYKALIDDSVSIDNIKEEYKIVDKRGRIWILEDK